MEFSSYFYHSNYAPSCITFIKNKNNLFEVIISTLDSEFYVLEDFNEHKFVLTYDELQKSKNLYKIYILSILMTENTKTLSYAENGINISNRQWYISAIKNWKRLYVTNHYDKCYAFETYPTEIIIEDIDANNDMKNYYLQQFEDDNYIYVTCNSKSINEYLNTNICKYIDYHTDLIDIQIKEVEKKIYSMKKYRLFVEKICKFKNIEDVSAIIFGYL
jgi:hypothetical protein